MTGSVVVPMIVPSQLSWAVGAVAVAVQVPVIVGRLDSVGTGARPSVTVMFCVIELLLP